MEFKIIVIIITIIDIRTMWNLLWLKFYGFKILQCDGRMKRDES